MSFSEALEAQIRQVEGDTNPKRLGSMIDTFAEMIKRAIAASGLKDMTEDEFAALVVKAWQTFAVSAGLNPIMVSIGGVAIDMIARRIYRKRINPTPTPNPA